MILRSSFFLAGNVLEFFCHVESCDPHALEKFDHEEDDGTVENRQEKVMERDLEDDVRVELFHGDARDDLQEFIDGGNHDELEDDEKDDETVYVEARDFPIPKPEDFEITHMTFGFIEDDTRDHRDDDDVKGDADVEEHVEYDAETLEKMLRIIGDEVLVEFGYEIVLGEGKFFVGEIGVKEVRVFVHDVVEMFSRRKNLERGVLGEDVFDLESDFSLMEWFADADDIADGV